MRSTSTQTDVLIVGAGLAGLSAARQLSDAGLSVVVVEREAVAGGRIATQSIEAGYADTGAQFFTVRTADFQEVVDRWLAAGWVYEWSRGWSDGSPSDGSKSASAADGFPRYAARHGFAALARHLAAGLDVRPATLLDAVMVVRDGGNSQWSAVTAGGGSFHSQTLILTSPAPESLALLDKGGVMLPPDVRQTLGAFQYGPCLCGIFVIDGDIDLPEPGALQRLDEPLSWLADNQRKGISPDARVLTAHANPQASAERWAWIDEAVLEWMAAEIRPRLAPEANIRQAALKRWPYAVPLTVYPERCLAGRTPAPLLFAGDVFGGPRIEGAVLSGLAAADSVTGYQTTASS